MVTPDNILPRFNPLNPLMSYIHNIEYLLSSLSEWEKALTGQERRQEQGIQACDCNATSQVQLALCHVSRSSSFPTSHTSVDLSMIYNDGGRRRRVKKKASQIGYS